MHACSTCTVAALSYIRVEAWLLLSSTQPYRRADSLPAIKPAARHFSAPLAHSSNSKPVRHHQTTGSPKALPVQQQHGSLQQAKQHLQALVRQPITSIAAAAAAAIQQQKQQLSVQVPLGTAGSHQPGPASPQPLNAQQRQHSNLQEPPAPPPGSPIRQTLADAARSASFPSSKWRNTGSFAGRNSRPGIRQQPEQEEDPFLAQRKLHLLPGLENVDYPAAEAAAGRRIRALPHVLCRAANGELYRMEIG